MNIKKTLKTDEDKPKKAWKGKYKGIPYEVVQWFTGVSDPVDEVLNEIWNYYIQINLDRIKDKDKREALNLQKTQSGISDREFYNTYEIDKNTGIYFHGGCTFYEKLDADNPLIKMGCDYAHFRDTPPGLDLALKDVKQTINSFYEWVGIYLRRCRGCGDYFEPGTGIENDRGWEDKCGGSGDFCN